MTMPNAATAILNLGGVTPAEMSGEQLGEVIAALRCDLGDEVIDFIEKARERPSHCGCGAFHLRIDDPQMTDEVRQSLLRLVASPFGDVFATKYGEPHLRFGWEGLEKFLPEFMAEIVRHPGTQEAWGKDITDEALTSIVASLRHELPGVVEMIEGSARNARDAQQFCGFAVTPAMAGGDDEWKSLIDRLMLAGATPVRKITDEWIRRQYGVLGGVVNCCCYPAEPLGNPEGFGGRRWIYQVSQQLTPDC